MGKGRRQIIDSSPSPVAKFLLDVIDVRMKKMRVGEITVTCFGYQRTAARGGAIAQGIASLKVSDEL